MSNIQYPRFDIHHSISNIQLSNTNIQDSIFDIHHSSDQSALREPWFPLPHLGLSYSYELTPRLVAGANVLGFALELDDFSGWLLEVNGVLSYQVTEHFGIGGGLKYYNVNVTSDSSSGNTRFDMQVLGPAVFLYGSF